ncbi:putative parvulin-type peptidyl-prolyl cis-trans isomerase [Sulfurimicrobium lacus]|uniref:peptidylprolyl isomerase n=1 Tax=Sulfurimicrobium lacus TaxID=2715678 RepID=A0A6F8VDU8_9PROT|nr:peptidylprolyl isomerase [Sulfurimicrobium lacus]BCB27888.1 putative parvulin-type peptidyl-prolyl cis-trans isomerase [Sulfurimicrobium lacus]
MMTIKSRILLVSAASLLTLSACNADESSKTAAAPAAGNVAATVNGTAISKARVDLLVKQRAGMGQPDSPEMRKSIIDQLAMQMLVSQEATKKGLDKSPEVVDQIELTKQSILANAFVQDYIKSHPVTDDMLKAEYDKVKAEMTGTEYKARHILVGSEAEGKDIIAKLKKNPKAFDALAKEKSKDPGSKDKGGELGWFDPRGMVPEFGAAVAKLGKGKMTDEPVKTQFGYHVIVMEDSRPMQIPPLDQVKPQLTQKVQQEQLKSLIDDMKAKAKIEITAAPAEAPAAPAAPAK